MGQRIIHKVTQHLAQQRGIAMHALVGCHLHFKPFAGFFCDNRVSLGKGCDQCRKVHKRRFLRRQGRAGFKLRDAEQPSEGGKHRIQFSQSGFKGRAIGIGITCARKCGFQLLAQAGKRPAQIMRDIHRDLPHAFDQRFLAFQQRIHRARQPVEFIGTAGQGQTPRQITAHHLFGGFGDAPEAQLQPARHE